MIGLLADSRGDLAAFDAAYELLLSRGATRFFFAGGRYADVDAWAVERRARERGGRAYSDVDFLADVAGFLSAGDEPLKARFCRTPERDSAAYHDPAVTRCALDMLGDTLCCLVHDKDELGREDLENSRVFIHGASGAPGLVTIGPRVFITPGALSGVGVPSCGLLETEGGLWFSAFALADGRALIERQALVTERRTKLQVK